MAWCRRWLKRNGDGVLTLDEVYKNCIFIDDKFIHLSRRNRTHYLQFRINPSLCRKTTNLTTEQLKNLDIPLIPLSHDPYKTIKANGLFFSHREQGNQVYFHIKQHKILGAQSRKREGYLDFVPNNHVTSDDVITALEQNMNWMKSCKTKYIMCDTGHFIFKCKKVRKYLHSKGFIVFFQHKLAGHPAYSPDLSPLDGVCFCTLQEEVAEETLEKVQKMKNDPNNKNSKTSRVILHEVAKKVWTSKKYQERTKRAIDHLEKVFLEVLKVEGKRTKY